MHVAPAQFLCAIPAKPTGLNTELNTVVYVRSAKPASVYNPIVMSGLLSGFVYSYVSCSMRQVPCILICYKRLAQTGKSPDIIAREALQMLPSSDLHNDQESVLSLSLEPLVTDE